MHDVQKDILERLLYVPSSSFGQLKKTGMENSQFVFHVDVLIDAGLVEKKDGMYMLTQIGKLEANRRDEKSPYGLMQGKNSVVCIVTRNTGKEILLYTRGKHPFFGCQGCMTGKIRFGETAEQACEREVYEEAGITGVAEWIATRQFIVRDEHTGEILEDKWMHVCLMKDPQGEVFSSREGVCVWVSLQVVFQFAQKPLVEFQEMMEILQHKELWGSVATRSVQTLYF